MRVGVSGTSFDVHGARCPFRKEDSPPVASKE